MEKRHQRLPHWDLFRRRLLVAVIDRNQAGDGWALILRSEADETNHPDVKLAVGDGELAEILIDGYEDARFCDSGAKDVLVAGIRLPVARPDDVVAGLA
jgi:hypothetical protein